MSTIFILACVLGSAVPLLMIFVLYEGIDRSPFSSSQKSRYKISMISYVFVWTLLVWLLGEWGAFSYHPGDMIPRFIIPLMLPVALGLYLLKNHNFRIILDSAPLSFIVGMQTFRLMGVLFIFVVNAGLAPVSFVSGGYGDIITGLLALLAAIMLYKDSPGAKTVTWAFMVAGVADLLNVAIMLLIYYPTWSSAQPSSAGAAEFPLVLVLGLAAPIALTFHIYTLRRLLLVRATSKA